ncbi:MAG: Ig-like domain-containing protein, partial [Gallionellaceae bacterium]|nr:Ig-like domain-containing protein [Gallionellaceae bacterium]
GLADSAAVNITVDSVNDPPIANPDPIVINEDVTSTFDPRANDTDMDTPHDQLVITSLNGQPVDPANPTGYLPSDVLDPVSGQVAGQVAMTTDGQVRFDPATDYHSDPAHPLVIPYTVSDGQGGSDSSTITLQVNPLNDNPVAVDDSADITEDDLLPATGNVLANDSDADGDDLDVVGFHNGGAALDTDGSLAGQYGTLTWDAETGAYEYTLDNASRQVQKLGAGDTLTETFGYAMADGHSPEQAAILTITIHGKDDGIVITGIGAAGGDLTVHENDLPAGSSPDASALERTGSFSIEALDGIQSLSVGGTTLTAAELLASSTYPVSIATTHGNLVLTGYSGDDQGGTLAYRYALATPVDNDSEPGADDAGYIEAIAVSVTDADGDLASSAVNVHIVDDTPLAQAIVVDGGARPVDTNLLIVLDTSGSMGDPSGMHDLNRLQAAVAAIHELIEQYQGMGDVMVNIVWFSTSAQVQDHDGLGGVWLTVDQAKAFLDGLQAAGWTNYDAALAATMEAYDKPGKLTDAQDVAYFMSDGYPTHNNDDIDTLGSSPAVDGATTPDNPFDDADDGIQAAERAAWRDFLRANDINTFSIGMGTDVDRTALDPAGYDGLGEVEQPAIEVHDMNDLSSVLASTVRYTASGSLLAGGSLGADGGQVRGIQYAGASFVFDGTTLTASGADTMPWQFDPMTHRLTLTTDGGSLSVDMDSGAYTYRHRDPGVLTAAFTYTLVDHDGDTASNTLTFSFSDVDRSPIVRDDAILMAADPLATLVTVPDEWLLWNDGHSDLIAISQVTEAMSHANGEVTDGLDGNGAGGFTYTGATATGRADTGHVTIQVVDAIVLDGNGLDNILVGDDSDEALLGHEGNDVLIGHDGIDQLDGGSGRDLLLGSAGDDVLTGGMGGDVFVWRLADRAAAGAPAIDQITDFTVTEGDVLDLRDLLDGEQHGANDIGNLLGYLDIATVAGDTIIRVSTQGGFSGGNYATTAEDQRIVLKNADLYAQFGVTPGQESELIDAMLKQGHLLTD